MSAELARFQNFAKLKDMQIAFNDITVLAGKPSTGKSYVMKFMYAVDEAYNKLSAELEQSTNSLTRLKSEIHTLETELSILNGQYNDSKFQLNNLFRKKDKEVELKLKEIQDKEKIIGEEIELLERKSPKNIDNGRISENCCALALLNVLKAIFVELNQISNDFIVTINKNKTIKFNNNTVNIDIKNKVNKKNQNTENSIFVETPLILEFKKFMNRTKGKTPYHIESLLNILDTDYSFTDEKQDKFIKDFTQKSKEIIKGDIESSGDSFIFNQKGGQNYDILNASSGTKSIGLLQYLVTNKALKKGSVLYWEEPEVHLHPEWQLKMVELFVELMNAGVKIVFSTHSPYMCDYLNAISQKRKFADRVSFNLFKESDGVVDNHILKSDEEWNMIQAELLDPLEEIMWEYI